MKLLTNIQNTDTSNLFLYGAIMFANIDYIGIVDYVLKAILGGAVWFGFKLLQDYFSVRVRMKAKEDLKEHLQHKEDDDNNDYRNKQ